MSSQSGLYVAYGALMSGALVPIYYGAFASLPPSPLPATAADSDADAGSDEDEATLHSEALTSSEAYLFPLLGSAVLAGMYVLVKLVDRRYLDVLLGAYFGIVGAAAVWKSAHAVFRGIIGRTRWASFTAYRLVVTREEPAKQTAKKGRGKSKAKKAAAESVFATKLSVLSLPLGLLSGAIVLSYLYTKHWVLSNILALSLAHSGITLMALDSFRTGGIMLLGLFAYDIFWVFGTDVMVSVARGLDGPIKIVFPKNFADGLQRALEGAEPDWKLTMLGLGDIVIPGIFIALALRFDLAQHRAAHPTSRTRRAFRRPYFRATLAAYVAGLATTMGVMHVFQAAQPALLYLSPACILAVLGTALRRGEVGQVWAWSEEDDAEEEHDADKED